MRPTSESVLAYDRPAIAPDGRWSATDAGCARAPAETAVRTSVDAAAQRQRRNRLLARPDALTWLQAEVGLDRNDIESGGYGLDLPYTSRVDGRARGPWITLPVRDSGGRELATLCKIAVPGLTNGAAAEWWKAGECLTFYLRARQHPTVLVTELLDLCHLSNFADLPFLDVIASTDALRTPREWEDAAFWRAWQDIVLAVPEAKLPGGVQAALSSVGLRVRVVKATEEGPLRAALFAGRPLDGLLAHARSWSPDKRGIGQRLATFRPVDLGRDFYDGRLHYPFEAIVGGVEQTSHGAVDTRRLQTMVVTSDGALLTVEVAPAPRGTPPERRVYRLSDATLIDGPPKAPSTPSWSLAGIEAFLSDPRQPAPPLAGLLSEIEAVLARHVWLPHDEDFAVLAIAVAASYVQPIFRSLPIILATGGAGTGKSTLGILMARLGCNGTLAAQVSAAAAARMIHETRGLVVLDDLEGIAARSRRGGFSDLIQWLKVSYNRDTAVKAWVDAGRAMKVERLNGFGMKVITNTGGAEPILATRMIVVPTAFPPADALPREDLSLLDAGTVDRVRDRLHLWAFRAKDEIAATYARSADGASDRAHEIGRPLRSLATLSGDARLCARLERALGRERKAPTAAAPRDVLNDAVLALARAGYRRIAPTQVLLEMRRIGAERHGVTHALAALADVDPEWVGHELRAQGLVDARDVRRSRIRGRNLRFVGIRPGLAPASAPEPDTFCTNCARCPYSDLACPLANEGTDR